MMRRTFYYSILMMLLSVTNLSAQDVQVVGASSQRPVDRVNGEIPELFLSVGGPKKSDYKMIGEPAYECIYDYIISRDDKNGKPIKENYVTILQMGKDSGRFTDYTTFRRDSVTFSENPSEKLWTEMSMEEKKAEYRFTGDIILNYPQGKLTYTDIVTPFYQEYTESFPPMEWQIEEQQDTVCGYLCTRATGSYGGRDWEVWFAEDIPSDLGPWKFSGMPGLILRAKDTEGVHEFEAISFREGETPIVKPNNPAIQKTTRDKFIDMKQKFEAKPMSAIDPETIQEMSISHGRIIVNKVEVPSRPNGYTPIELK